MRCCTNTKSLIFFSAPLLASFSLPSSSLVALFLIHIHITRQRGKDKKAHLSLSEGRHMRLHTSALLMESKHLVHWAPVGKAIPSQTTPGRRGGGHQDPGCYRQHSAALLPALWPCVPGAALGSRVQGSA